MNSYENTDQINESIVTSQSFDMLKKISNIRKIYLRAFKRSMNKMLEKDLPMTFKDGNEEMFKDIKRVIIHHLAKFMDEKFMSLIELPEVYEKLKEYYKLDSKYQNKPIKFTILAAEEETSLKEEAFDTVKNKRESMQELVDQNKQMKDNKYEELNQIFDEIVEHICKYDSISTMTFDKEDLFH